MDEQLVLDQPDPKRRKLSDNFAQEMSTIVMPQQGGQMVPYQAPVRRRSYRKRRSSYSSRRSSDTVYKLKRRIRNKNAAIVLFKKALALPQGSEGSVNMFGADWKSANPGQRAARSTLNYRGAGAYSWKDIGKYAMRGGGAVLGGIQGYMSGGLEGALAGGRSGWIGGRKMSKYLGLGAYEDGSGVNSLISGPSGNRSISVNNEHRSGDIEFAQTEFVQNIYASVDSAPASSAFQLQEFDLNPGLANTFPFLSQLATSFELFEFEGLMFEYRPTSGEFGNNSSNSLGKVILCTNYDPEADVFQNSVQMENYDYANSTKPSGGAVHGVETAPDQRATKLLYVRSGDVTKSKIFTDLGKFMVATEGIPFGGSGPQTSMIGELWVTYKVRLSRSQLFSNILGGDIGWGMTSYPTVVPPNIGTPTYEPGATFQLDADFDGKSNLQILFPSELDDGYYLVKAEWEETKNVAPGDITVTLTNAVGAVRVQQFPDSANESVDHCVIFAIQLDAPSTLNRGLINLEGDAAWGDGEYSISATNINKGFYDAFNGL
jgi:Viral coat protein (S domain).